MEPNNYHCSIAANITPDQAFATIANVAGWWTNSFKGAALSTGDTFTVQFGDTWVAFAVIEAQAGKKIVWKVTDCHLHWLSNKTEWTGTTIVWEITVANNVTKIDMTHVSLQPGIECYESCTKGWNEYIADSMFKLVTDGVGAPHKVAEVVA